MSLNDLFTWPNGYAIAVHIVVIRFQSYVDALFIPLTAAFASFQSAIFKQSSQRCSIAMIRLFLHNYCWYDFQAHVFVLLYETMANA